MRDTNHLVQRVPKLRGQRSFPDRTDHSRVALRASPPRRRASLRSRSASVMLALAIQFRHVVQEEVAALLLGQMPSATTYFRDRPNNPRAGSRSEQHRIQPIQSIAFEHLLALRRSPRLVVSVYGLVNVFPTAGASDVGVLHAEPVPMLVQPPGAGRQARQTRLDQHELESEIRSNTPSITIEVRKA